MKLKNLKCLLLFILMISAIWSYSLIGNANPSKSAYIQSLETLLRKQAKEEAVTAKIIINPAHPNITNMTTGYFLTDMLSKLDQLPKNEEGAFKVWVKKNESWLPAPIIMELGHLEFATNPQECFKWAALGRFRAAYDAKRCMDPHASSTPGYMLIERQSDMRGYAKGHQKEVLNAMEEALSWDEKHPSTASPMWLCAHSMNAMKFDKNTPLPVSVKTLLQPESTWAEFRNQVKTIY